MRLEPRKKLSKSTIWYLISGGIGVIVIAIILAIYCIVAQINVIEWLGSKWAMIAYAVIGVYIVIGIILLLKDFRERM